jgi:hypothetical protein
MSQRPLLLSLILVGGTLAAGCTTEGSYRLAWTFADAPAAAGCGAHGVDGVHITGGNMAGDSEDIIAVCSAGEIVRTRPIGTWSLVVHQLDVRGVQITVPDQRTADFMIAEDARTDVDPAVVLEARPECADGVDNDGDRRLDTDDPDCTGDPMGPTE